ncbi:LOW QUALITY PROTEIN: uncharacterized protein LOC110230853 [Arabidopsis lyrata subsp. lyrata]|uniref:LOW QUALITY PROTEIN: uncharacterized protein LOC110230853 n=1 Tax=Arabidopsis lyrata subsp. lyrata TaxID=81972 RepID=UPI000A29E532|nr:LOW QUALITY PROTEIN: uncharacterized protein LOC110230853 [Arabidopsis lyrata subsp. lyrata]|eukprot:XP_020890698.1 LOW QUALITY PROTEIN: uncharacterized protein LOC110230853 [Arabidopsis lyrata subsp. lyrata]
MVWDVSAASPPDIDPTPTEATTILYDYERIQKRCYFCQRLTHERPNCPLFNQQQLALKGSEPSQHVAETILDSSSLNSPNCAGRIRIDPMVLEELRQFFVASSELNRFSSQIQSTSSEDIVEMDHTITLNPVSTEGSDRSKGKAIVLEPENKKATSDSSKEPFSRQTLSILSSPDFITDGSAVIMKDFFGNKGSFTSAPSFSEAGTSKPFTKRAYVRKKPYKSRSNLKGTSLSLSKGWKNLRISLTWEPSLSRRRNRLSLLARPLNNRAQNLHTVVASLPRLWGLASRIHGRVLSDTYIQFLFQSEADLVSVQRRAPWVFNNWFIASQRWEDFSDVYFLTTLDLWVQIRGIPLPYVSEGTARFIAATIGQVIYLDFHDETTTDITFIRVRIRIGITDSLRFFRRVCFESRERAMISFQYESLRRICSRCLQLTHQSSHCPYNHFPHTPRNSPEVIDVPVYNRRRTHGQEIHSNHNSHSQNSDDTFPTPLTPPPRLDSPPLNPDEFAAAYPQFPVSSLGNLQHMATSTTHTATWRRHSSTGSTTSPSIDEGINSRMPRYFEVGESSKRTNSHFNNRDDDRQQKKKLQEDEKGGILKPPKKR